jgi:hypothetical protein
LSGSRVMYPDIQVRRKFYYKRIGVEQFVNDLHMVGVFKVRRHDTTSILTKKKAKNDIAFLI